MYIKEIRLKNYRCYKDAKIKFGLDPESGKNINLATGEIKAGKTTLFNAIGWCLYDKETQFLLGTKLEEKDEKPIPNEKSYEGNKAIVEVEIDIRIPENRSIESLSIRRVSTFVKGATSPTSTDFSIAAYYAGERINISDDYKFLNQFLPKDLIQFYLFDGEYLQHTATNSNFKIREGLKKLFNIEKIENASEMIGELIEEWYKQSSKMPKQNSKMADIDKEIAILLEKKRDKDVKIQEEEKNKAEFISQREMLKEELSKSQALQEAMNRFSSLEEKERGKEEQLKQENKSYYTTILTNAYLINGKTILKQVNELVEKDPKVKGLPANVRAILLNHLLKREICVCGNHIKKGSVEEKSIISELKVAELEGHLDFLLDITSKIPEMLKSTDEKVTAIRDKFEYIKKLEDERKDIIKKKNEVQKELPKGKIDVNTYTNNLNKFTALSDDLRDTERNLMTYRNEIADFEVIIENLKQTRDRISDKSEEASRLNNSIKTGEYLKKIFDQFNRGVLNNVALELEAEINNLIAQNKKISELTVKITTDNNNIDFKFVERGSTKHYLTGGQNQLFGIIIMAAFVRIMDKRGRDKLPFVFMDNPFSSIDKESLEIVSTNLSDLFKNAQVILFTTNDKFDRVYNASKENIVTAITLTNDGTNVKLSM